MSHKIIAVFQNDVHDFDKAICKYLENDPSCKEPLFDWYSYDNGTMYYEPFPYECPDDTGCYRKSQYNFTAYNENGCLIKLEPSAFITPDGEIHKPKGNDRFEANYVYEWDSYLNEKDDPYVEFADCTMFD